MDTPEEKEEKLSPKDFADKIYEECLRVRQKDEEYRTRKMIALFREAWKTARQDFFLFVNAFKGFEKETFIETYYFDSKKSEDDEFGLSGYRFVNINSDTHTELRQITDLRKGILYSKNDGELVKVSDLELMLPMELLRLCDDIKHWKDINPYKE